MGVDRLLPKHRNSLSYRMDVRYLSASWVDNLKKRFLPEYILRVAEGVEMTLLDLGNSPLSSGVRYTIQDPEGKIYN